MGFTRLFLSKTCYMNNALIIKAGYKSSDDEDLCVSISVFLFNAISTFMGYIMPKPSLWKYSSDTIQPITEGIRELIPLPRLLAQK